LLEKYGVPKTFIISPYLRTRETAIIFLNILEKEHNIKPFTDVSHTNAKHKIAYICRVNNYSDVAKTLNLLKPYLVIKHHQASNVLNFCNYRLKLRQRHGYFPKHDSNSVIYYQKSRELNRRGV
jgi:uncharacterized protein YlbG (UPF0298 family)